MKLPSPSASTSKRPPRQPRQSAPRRALAARVPHCAWAVAVLAAFAAAAAVIADDYGMTLDNAADRRIAEANLQYIMGDGDALPEDHLRYYGVAFEMPLLVAERALRLTDSRDIFLLRRALSHLFFLCGAFACYALVYRLFNSVPVALLAMLLFLLHPRLYAHSFFNTKDTPFLAMFMIALCLMRWAFAKNSAWAFAVLGACVGLAANIRIMGVMLVPAVLGLQAFDFAFSAAGSDVRRRVLTAGAAFAAAFAAALYASAPYLWANPLEIINAFAALSDHPVIGYSTFQGVRIPGGELPLRYIPTWIWITTPPITLLFACLGVAAVLRRAAPNPAAAVRGGDIRFGFICVALFALPIIAMAAIDARLHSGWRHMQFTYAPICILAAFGIHWLPGEFKRAPFAAAFALWGTRALICAGLAATLIAMIQIHPYQQLYFNFFVDRQTPERLRSLYAMDYYQTANLAGLRYLLELHPTGPVFVSKIWPQNDLLLPERQRRRLIEDAADGTADIYHIANWNKGGHPQYADMPEIHSVKIYNSTVMTVYGGPADYEAKLGRDADRLRGLYAALTASDPTARAYYNIYVNPKESPEAGLGENSIAFLKEPCAFADILPRFLLHITPVNPGDLPESRKGRGYDNADFYMDARRSMIADKCLASIALPDYPIAAITTGQFTVEEGRLWTATIDLAAAK